MSQSKTAAPGLDLQRVAEEINVILTDIYGRYVQKGCPTKLGGLRFLDVESSKTFAFEKCCKVEGGNLLVLSAPYVQGEPPLEKALRKGPHHKDIREVTVRGSADEGKADKRFIEVSYFLPTAEWLTEENILDYAQKHNIVNVREAITGILKEKVLPYASEVMEYLVQSIRDRVSQT